MAIGVKFKLKQTPAQITNVTQKDYIQLLV